MAILISSIVTSSILIALIALLTPVLCFCAMIFMCQFQNRYDNTGFEGVLSFMDFFPKSIIVILF
jgi:hypothetical protein